MVKTLNESELRNLIAQKINEAMEDEGIWGGIKNVWNANRGKNDADYNNEKAAGKWGQSFKNGSVAQDIMKAANILYNEMNYLDSMGFDTMGVYEQLENIAKNLQRGGTRRTRQSNGRWGKNVDYNYHTPQSNGYGRRDMGRFIQDPMTVSA